MLPDLTDPDLGARPDPDLDRWVAARLPCDVVHLDVAACGRPSSAVLEAQGRHLRAEAAGGGYVAEAAAAGLVAAGRDRVGGLLGLAGADVALVDSAGTAFADLLEAWPYGAGARVGTVSSEYGANALVLHRVAAARGWTLVPLPVDDVGRVQEVSAGLDLVTFPQVASQRGIAQPVHDVLREGVPLLLDVAQSLGQVAVPAGCAAYVGTSRKWLCGPRGIGFLAVDPAVGPALVRPPTLSPYDDLRRFDAQETHVAGRVGLAVAAQEWTPAVLPVVAARSAYARQLLGQALGSTPWRVVEPVDEPTGITTLVGGDPVAVRAALLARGLLVSAVPASRAPDLDAPVLRISTGAWARDAELDAIAAALRLVTA